MSGDTLVQQLQALFAQHPQLRRKLKFVYDETLESSSGSSRTQSARYARAEPRWTEQKGFDQGLKVLKAKLDPETSDTDDVKVFAAWVKSRNVKQADPSIEIEA